MGARVELGELERQHPERHGQGEGALHAVAVDGAGAPGPDLQVPGGQHRRASQPRRPHPPERHLALPVRLLWLLHM